MHWCCFSVTHNGAAMTMWVPVTDACLDHLENSKTRCQRCTDALNDAKAYALCPYGKVTTMWCVSIHQVETSVNIAAIKMLAYDTSGGSVQSVGCIRAPEGTRISPGGIAHLAVLADEKLKSMEKKWCVIL